MRGPTTRERRGIRSQAFSGGGLAAYGSMHGTLAGSGTVVRETAQRRNSHSHRPCATRRGDDNMRCTERLRDALPTRSHEKIVRSHGSVRSHREQRAAARHMPDMGRWFSVTSIADVLGCTARQGCSGTVEIKGMDGGKNERRARVRAPWAERARLSVRLRLSGRVGDV
jgi:hypothetical protein